MSLDDKDEAFELLEQADSDRAYCMPWLRADQYMDPLREDPRFHDLMQRMNLEP